MDFRQGSGDPSELIVGIIGPIGCNRADVISSIEKLAHHYSYSPVKIQVSNLIEQHALIPPHAGDQYKRVTNLISAGNELRKRTGDNSILAKLAADAINKNRKEGDLRRLYIIDSLKHPEEVDELRNIYGKAFYLLAVSSSEVRREKYLEKDCHVRSEKKRAELITRDKDENIGYGQRTSDAFHRADFFLNEDGNSTKVWNTLERFFDIIFGDPFKTPTFHEFAMFMAYGASMRSADLSRQVGAVISRGQDILSTGANECPSPLGGTYWPIYESLTGAIKDSEMGRDYMKGFDQNSRERETIIKNILDGIPEEFQEKINKNIKLSGLKDITEFGRVVHAEMDAILTCARNGTSTNQATIFCTTFPCHNCAKHIIASGIKRVVYIEPYPKSKAFDFHPDAITDNNSDSENKILFTPFVGVGPRQFVDLFSMTLSFGAKIIRKKDGSAEKSEWNREKALPRIKVLPQSYIDNELSVAEEAKIAIESIEAIAIQG